MGQPMNETSFQDVILTRAFGYSFLHKAFYIEPTIEYIQLLAEQNYIKQFPYSNINGDIKKGIEQIEIYLNKNKNLELEEYNKLHWDYTRMFIGPRELEAPPWESYYRNKDKLLFQEETLQVRKSYFKYKFIPKNYPHEADDHIALELDFMYQLCNRILNSIEKNKYEEIYNILIDQKDFLENHLKKWVPIFSQKIIKNANTDFYKGISKLLLGFIQLDYDIVCELINEISGGVFQK